MPLFLWVLSIAVLVPIVTSSLAMNKISMIQTVLNKLYPNPPVPLNYNSPFTFLCAVVLSAQTTDGKVNQVTETLFKLAPDPLAMSKMKYDDVLKIIQPVGLAPKKSEYLINLSKILIEKFNGQVPGSFEELESLPGVGHKTASVVMSQIFGHPSLAVDTHVHRLALRWRLTKDERNPSQVQKDLCAVFPQSDWSKLHLQMIYFGREYCTAKLHNSSECPICSWINQPESKLAHAFEVASGLRSSSHSTTTAGAASSPFTPKTPPKGIISYSARHAELSVSPDLAPRLTMQDFGHAESKEPDEVFDSKVSTKAPSVPSKGRKKVTADKKPVIAKSTKTANTVIAKTAPKNAKRKNAEDTTTNSAAIVSKRVRRKPL